MQVVILAVGIGSRISEESLLKPKPLIEIGGKPILFHILKHYEFYGFNEFIICCGYKGELIKEYFSNYHIHNSDLKINLNENKISILKKNNEKWKITLADTGSESLTGKRIRKIKKYLYNDDNFCLTYGDGLSNINLNKLVQYHKRHKKLATLSAVQPSGRYGLINFNKNNLVKSFQEKPRGDGAWINGGFYVLNKKIFDFIDGNVSWESKPLDTLVKKKQLKVFKHPGFWKAMDTMSDKEYLEKLYFSNRAPWVTWKT